MITMHAHLRQTDKHHGSSATIHWMNAYRAKNELTVWCACDSLQSVLNDVSVVWRVFSLPVLEPMTRGRLEKIVAITMSCLHASLAATMATSMVAMTTASTQLRSSTASKDDEIDGYASNIVKKSVTTTFVIL